MEPYHFGLIYERNKEFKLNIDLKRLKSRYLKKDQIYTGVLLEFKTPFLENFKQSEHRISRSALNVIMQMGSALFYASS